MRNDISWTPPAQGSGRVLFPPAVDDREYLMGLVLKTASDNLHLNVAAILAAAGYPHARSFDLTLNRLDLARELARVLGTKRDELERLTFHKVRSFDALATVTFLGAESSSYDLVTRRRRVSGTTLRSHPFHRAVWAHGLLPYCPVSLDLLIDRCPGCDGKLDWYRASTANEPQWRSRDVNAIFRCGDPACGLDLRTASSTRLDGHVAVSYRRMAGLVAPADRHGGTWALHPGLRDLPPGSTFELGWSLARIFAEDGVPRARCKQLTSDVIIASLHLAEQLLSGWPDHLRGAFETDAREEQPGIVQRRLGRLRNLTRANAAWPEIGDLVRRTYPDMLERRRKSLRSLNPSVVTRTMATAIAGMHTATFARAAESGGLAALSSSGSRRAFQDFEVASVERLRDAKDGSIPCDAVSERLGISYHGVEQLVIKDLLEAEEHLALAAVYEVPRVKRHSLDKLIDGLVAAARSEAGDGYLPLRTVVKCLAGEKPWSSIFQAMLDGRLPFHFAEASTKVCRGIAVPASGVDMLRSFSFDRSAHPSFRFAHDMSRRDVEEALNLVPGTLQAALDQELGPDRSRGRIAVSDVEAIAQRAISAAEISARTSPGTRRFPRALKRSRFPRRGAAGWLRSEVEPLLEGGRDGRATQSGVSQ